MTAPRPKIEWTMNGKMITTINAFMLFVSIGVSVGTVFAHVQDTNIHQNTDQKAALIERLIEPIAVNQREHFKMPGHAVEQHQITSVATTQAAHIKQADERYERLLTEVVAIRTMLEEQKGKRFNDTYNKK